MTRRKPSTGNPEVIAGTRITFVQMYALKRIRDQGPAAWCVGSHAGGSVRKMFERMRAAGLVEGPPFVLTPKGAQVLQELGQ